MANADRQTRAEWRLRAARRQAQKLRARRRARRRGLLGRALVALGSMALALALLGGLFAVTLAGRTVALPDWARDRIEARLGAVLPAGQVHIGRAELTFTAQAGPQVRLRNVALGVAGGMAMLNEVGARLSPAAVLRGNVLPERLSLTGAQITLRRDASGRLSLDFGSAGGPADPARALAAVREAVFSPPLDVVRRIEARDVTITLEDARTGRVWQVTDGTLTLARAEDRVELTAATEIFSGTEDLATARFELTLPRDGSGASFGAQVDGVAARDIALQSPVLAFLSPLDAPISGALRADLGADARLAGLDGRLEIGKGALHPREDVPPVAFDSGRAWFDYDPATARIRFSLLEVDSDAAHLEGRGHADLGAFQGGFPTFVAQLAIDRAELAAGELFEAPLAFDAGASDFRLRVEPFTIEIGQVVLVRGDTRIRARGEVGIDPGGWAVALDLTIPRIAARELLELWPLRLIPNTRRWVKNNLFAGILRNVDAALRLSSAGPPKVGLDFDFEGAELRYLKSMPPITGGAGYASLIDDSFTVVMERGTVHPKEGGPVALERSVFRIEDVNRKPSLAEVSLDTASSVTAALSLLSEPPFRVLEKAPITPDVAVGRADVDAHITFPVKPAIAPGEVHYSAEATLSGVDSTALVPGRRIAADRLALRLSEDGVTIAGQGVLDQVPLDVIWDQRFGPEGQAGSRISGTARLTDETLRAFGVTLPRGWVSGATRARVELELRADAPPRLTLTSRLDGLAISVPPLAVSVGARDVGNLTVRAILEERPHIESLSLAAPGFVLEGEVTTDSAGGLGVASFSRVVAGEWLDVSATLTGQGAGKLPKLAVTGGRVDLRRLPDGLGGSSGEAEAGAGLGAIAVALDAVQITRSIALTSVQGRLVPGAAMSGQFTGRVNGGAAVEIALQPSQRGSVIRIVGQDAGAVARDAGYVRNARGGRFEAILTPTGEPRTYAGVFSSGRLRVVGLPILAELLSAVSVFGLIDQLNGDGIVFDDVQANFRLTPRAFILGHGAAVGISMGISADGYYDFERSEFDMQGVISPLYLFNGIGQLLTRRGEGLVGFNFTLRGPSSAPRISVNPLSLLTPGMFRDIFRRPPPRVGVGQ